jgi:fibronectin type 3 domain-containing protein
MLQFKHAVTACLLRWVAFLVEFFFMARQSRSLRRVRRISLNRILEQLESRVLMDAGPAAPAALTAIASEAGVVLQWSDRSNDEIGFKITRSGDGVNFNQVGIVRANMTSFVDTEAGPGTTYQYRVYAWNLSGPPAASNVAWGQAAAPSVAPAADTGLAASVVTQHSISLTWNDAAANESGHRIYRSTDGVNYALIANLAPDSTSYTDQLLSSSMRYFYKVTAYNAAGISDSNALGVTTASRPLKAPTGLAASTTTAQSVSLIWNDVAEDEAGYRLYRSTDGVNFSLVQTLSPDSTSFTDQQRSASTAYYYRVAAFNAASELSSSTLTVSTAAAVTVPPPAPPAPAPVTSPLGVAIHAMTGFQQLRVDGTPGNDSIVVSQSGSVLNVSSGGATKSYAGNFGELVIHGNGGADAITVDSSVNIAALVYADGGSDVIRNLTSAKATIVTIGDGVSNVTGNGANTAFWVNPGDVVNASPAEIALGGVNRVASFYQPWTSNTGSADYVPRTLAGQNLRDPSDAGATIRVTGHSLWGMGATIFDINQSSPADCYFLAPLASLANQEPARLMNLGVDLGDGTYAVKFVRNGVTSYVRVDGDLTAGWANAGLGMAYPGPNGNLWGSIFEKAYAFFRTGANTYASLNFGYLTQTFSEMGVAPGSTVAATGASTILNLVNSQLAAGHAMAAMTNLIVSGAPVIASHVYSIVGAYRDSAGTVMVRLRNPWGFDGAGDDGANDSYVTIPYDQFAANFSTVGYATV